MEYILPTKAASLISSLFRTMSLALALGRLQLVHWSPFRGANIAR